MSENGGSRRLAADRRRLEHAPVAIGQDFGQSAYLHHPGAQIRSIRLDIQVVVTIDPDLDVSDEALRQLLRRLRSRPFDPFVVLGSVQSRGSHYPHSGEH